MAGLYETNPYPGKLIVVEGIDGSGKSTQAQLLQKWLHSSGAPVLFTEWNSSSLVKAPTKMGKKRNLLTPTTFSLLHATDFADRFICQILPPLKAGMVVIANRYAFTAFARDTTRGVDPQWIRNIFSFALQPDLVLYLKADVKTLFRRSLLSKGLDYWESGRDQNAGLGPYDSFMRYQTRLLREFDRMTKEYDSVVINARRSVNAAQKNLRESLIAAIHDLLKPKSLAHDTGVRALPTAS